MTDALCALLEVARAKGARFAVDDAGQLHTFKADTFGPDRHFEARVTMCERELRSVLLLRRTLDPARAKQAADIVSAYQRTSGLDLRLTEDQAQVEVPQTHGVPGSLQLLIKRHQGLLVTYLAYHADTESQEMNKSKHQKEMTVDS